MKDKIYQWIQLLLAVANLVFFTRRTKANDRNVTNRNVLVGRVVCSRFNNFAADRWRCTGEDYNPYMFGAMQEGTSNFRKPKWNIPVILCTKKTSLQNFFTSIYSHLHLTIAWQVTMGNTDSYCSTLIYLQPRIPRKIYGVELWLTSFFKT